MNQVTIIGNLGRDAEVKDAGKFKVTRLHVAVTKKYKKDNEWQEETSWFLVKSWGEYPLIKGSRVMIEGSLKEEKWKNSAGENRSMVVIDARNVYTIKDGKKKEEEEKGVYQGNVQEDDLPF